MSLIDLIRYHNKPDTIGVFIRILTLIGVQGQNR